MKKNTMKPIIVCTEYRGIFFGYVSEDTDLFSSTITLENCRNCIRFDASIKGFGGLASTGPNKECRIGPAMPWFQARKVTAVIGVTSEAVEAWENAPWK